MNASTRKWVSLSALGLLALDLGAFAIAAPRAHGWLERARTSNLIQSGAAALRSLERLGTRGAGNAGYALLTRFAHRSSSAYTFILGATPPGGMRAHERTCARRNAPAYARSTDVVIVESTPVETVAPAIESDCPLSTCPLTNCPKRAVAPSTAAASSASGLPTSALRLTIE